jgi:hypothetical protein
MTRAYQYNDDRLHRKAMKMSMPSCDKLRAFEAEAG